MSYIGVNGGGVMINIDFSYVYQLSFEVPSQLLLPVVSVAFVDYCYDYHLMVWLVSLLISLLIWMVLI